MMQRSLVILAIQLASLQAATGCAASPHSAASAPPVAMPAQPPSSAADAPAPAPAPPPPSVAPSDAARGYSKPEMDMPAAYRQPAPAAAPGGARSAPTKAPVAAKKAPEPPPPPPAKGTPPPPPPGKTETGKAATAQAPVPGTPAAPLLIYVGDMQMQVEQEEFAKTLDKVIDVAEALGGYLAGRKDNSVQIRVPSQRFRESLTRIEDIGEVTHRSVTADDVSEQYSDLEVRLVNLKATRQRLQEFLARAGNMADMLQVERELERVAAEIEQIEGKMRFLRSRAAFSLVTVTLTAKPKPVTKIVETPPPPPPPREVELPIDWLRRVGVGRLLDLRQR